MEIIHDDFWDRFLEDSSFEDVDPAAIEAYRQMRSQTNSNAEELNYTNEDLLHALSVMVSSKESKHLTVAGLILFGKSIALRRLFPMSTRIDYIMIEGREWVPDPDRRYLGVEIRESLLTGIPRLLQHIMSDKKDIDWFKHFKEYKLSNDEARTLITSTSGLSA